MAQSISYRRALLWIVCFALFAGAVALFFRQGWQHEISLGALKANRDSLQGLAREQPITALLAYLGIYIAVTLFSLPGAAILTLAGGAIFGLLVGSIAASIASVAGASAAFLVVRFLLRDWVSSHAGRRLAQIEEGFRREGRFYLFSLRLIPVIPFFFVNILMGLTPMKLWDFVWVSWIGMLPATIAYVNAGTQLSRINSARDVLSPRVILSFAILGVLPLISKKILRHYRSGHRHKTYRRPARSDYNLIVIGGGSGGLVAAYLASTLKARVALIEKDRMGGECLNTGCVPSKALIRSARVLSLVARARDFGFRSGQMDFDFAEVMERVQRVIRKVEPHDSAERYRAMGVEVFHASARLLSPYEVQVGDRVMSTRSVVIATGGRPAIPKIPGLDRVPYLTSDTVWGLRRRPERMLFIGGGPISCELAQCFARLGSQVTIVQHGPQLLPREDLDAADSILRRFEGEGIRVLLGAQVRAVETGPDRKELLLERAGVLERVRFDEVLVATGRKANVQGFGLEDLEVTLGQKGTIEADPFLRTNYSNVYVCGDVTGPYQFTHYAGLQGQIAALNALFSPFKKFRIDNHLVPWCTFTDPEVARVGLNEREARERHIAFETAIYRLSELDRAITEGEDSGFVKVLTPPGKDRILGVTIVGESAGEILAEFVIAMKRGIGLKAILGTIHVYPTLSEANKYVAGEWQKRHVPERALRALGRFHRWRR